MTHDLAQRVFHAAHLTGSFTLRSGATSSTYFDKYQFEADPVLLRDICSGLVPLIPGGTQVLCGLELGGVPIATVLSQLTGLPTAYLRKQAKTYGTCRFAEGADLHGRRICLVEDVVSSGGAILDMAELLRADQITVSHALCVIDRETGGRQTLAAQEIELHALLTQTAVTAANTENSP